MARDLNGPNEPTLIGLCVLAGSPATEENPLPSALTEPLLSLRPLIQLLWGASKFSLWRTDPIDLLCRKKKIPPKAFL